MSEAPIRRFKANVRDGKPHYYHPTALQQEFIKFEGKQIYVSIEEVVEETTDSQHGYYRGVILPECLSYECFGGWNEDELHQEFIKRFLTTITTKTIGDEIVENEVRGSTAKIGKKKMAKFIDDVLNYVATLNIYIDPPENYVKRKV